MGKSLLWPEIIGPHARSFGFFTPLPKRTAFPGNASSTAAARSRFPGTAALRNKSVSSLRKEFMLMAEVRSTSRNSSGKRKTSDPEPPKNSCMGSPSRLAIRENSPHYLYSQIVGTTLQNILMSIIL